jgi:hypothetical protein
MTVDSSDVVQTDPANPDFAAVLAKVTTSLRPTTAQVVEALLQAEKIAKQQRIAYPLEALLGEWRLCFATGTRKVRRGGIVLGAGFYWPRWLPAQISFVQNETDAIASPLKISNQVQVAGLRLQFTGPARYTGKKNLLVFDFTQMQVSAWGQVIYQGKLPGRSAQTDFAQQAIAKLPFFAFFWVTEEAIAARGRGGGLAIWMREQG